MIEVAAQFPHSKTGEAGIENGFGTGRGVCYIPIESIQVRIRELP